MQLDQEFLSNPIRSYLYILAILVGTFIFKRFISRFFASLIYTWVDKKNHSELRKSHVHRLVVPIEQFLLFLVAVVALYELQFPVLWDVHLFKVSLQQAIDSIVKLLFIILLIRVFIRTLEFVAIILEEKNGIIFSKIPLKIVATIKYGTDLWGLNDTKGIYLNGVLTLKSKTHLTNWKLTTNSTIERISPISTRCP